MHSPWELLFVVGGCSYVHQTVHIQNRHTEAACKAHTFGCVIISWLRFATTILWQSSGKHAACVGHEGSSIAMLPPRASHCLLLILAEASGGVLVMAGKGADRTANIRQHVFKREFSCEMPSKEMPSQICEPEMPLYHMRHICLCVSSSACSSQAVRCGLFVFAYNLFAFSCLCGLFFPSPNPDIINIFGVKRSRWDNPSGQSPL